MKRCWVVDAMLNATDTELENGAREKADAKEPGDTIACLFSIWRMSECARACAENEFP